MFTSHISKIRNTMHTFSRAPLADGQKWIDQATLPAGHNIYYDKIRASSIPVIPDIQTRDAYYTIVEDGHRKIGGEYGQNFVDVLKFIEKASIREIAKTNGESYCIVDENSVPITGFVDPADAPIALMAADERSYRSALSEGYDIHMFDESGVEISRNYGWSFDSFNGILHFSPDMNPKTPNWPFGNVTVDGIIYIGKYVSTLLEDYKNGMDTAISGVESKVNSALDIQPFFFSTDNMTPIGDPYPAADQSVFRTEFFQLLTVTIPAYVFELTKLDSDVTILTDMKHLPNGSTQIFMNLPWHPEYQRPIVRYDVTDTSPFGEPYVGKYRFCATGFVNKDGSTITVNEPIIMDDTDTEPVPAPGIAPSRVPVPPPHGYYPYPLPPPPPPRPHGRPGRPMPPPPPPYGYYSDDDVYINVDNH